MCDGVFHIQIFLLCIPLASLELERGLTDKLQMQCGVKTLTQFMITGRRTHY